MHPVLLVIPGLRFPVYGYSLMLGLSFLVAWYLVLGLCRRDHGLAPGRAASLFVVTAVSALLGARILYVITNVEQFARWGDVLRVGDGGLVAYGGFLGGFAGSAWFCRRTGTSLLAWADTVVPSLATGLVFTRIGCFLAGCDFGAPSSLPWAVRFPRESPAWRQQLADGLIGAAEPASLPAHPTQLYEAALGLVLLVVLLVVRRRGAFPGQALIVFTVGYAVGRSAIEVLRADAERGTVGPLSTSQFLGAVTLLAAVAAGVVLRARRDRAGARGDRRAGALT